MTEGGSKYRNRFPDDKPIILPDGRPIETVPMCESQIHWDDKILGRLALYILVQAVKDWQKLNQGEKRDCVKAEGGIVWRFELLKFFNGSFCSNILELVIPEMDIEEALLHMDSASFTNKQIGIGRGGDFRSGRRRKVEAE